VVGLLDDAEKTTDVAFKAEGHRILLVGTLTGELGGSEFIHSLGKKEGRPPALNTVLELAVQQTVRSAIREGLVSSAHDCSEGGLAVALAESCLAGGIGARVKIDSALAPSALLFSEEPSRVVVSCAAENVAKVVELAKRAGAPVMEIGAVGGNALAIEGIATVTLEAAHKAYEGALPKIAGDEA
jgi:phosphoribosylformylglycinamidine synthase